MYVILKRVQLQTENGESDYGFYVFSRNQIQGRLKFHIPTKNSYILSQRIYQYGFLAAPLMELDELISLGVKLWMNQPEGILNSLENIITNILISYSVKFKLVLMNGITFKQFNHLYYNYSQQDELITHYVDAIWSKCVTNHNEYMNQINLPSSSHITEENSDLIRGLVIRLITKGTRYAVRAFRGNVALANKLFILTEKALSEYMLVDAYSRLVVLIDKNEERVEVSTELPRRLARYVKDI